MTEKKNAADHVADAGKKIEETAKEVNVWVQGSGLIPFVEKHWQLVLIVLLAAGCSFLYWRADVKADEVRSLQDKLTIQGEVDEAKKGLADLRAQAIAQAAENAKLIEQNKKDKAESQKLWFQIQKRRAELDAVKPQQVMEDVKKLPIGDKLKELQDAGIDIIPMKATVP